MEGTNGSTHRQNGLQRIGSKKQAKTRPNIPQDYLSNEEIRVIRVRTNNKIYTSLTKWPRDDFLTVSIFHFPISFHAQFGPYNRMLRNINHEGINATRADNNSAFALGFLFLFPRSFLHSFLALRWNENVLLPLFRRAGRISKTT